jgi:two-component system, OmpR family, KDP operon response regulator KdpE
VTLGPPLRRPAPGCSSSMTSPRCSALYGSKTVRLTPTQWRLLEILLRHPGQLVATRRLLTEIWGPGYERYTNYLRVHMSGLRHKLEPDPSRPRHLLTEPGMGYRYQP